MRRNRGNSRSKLLAGASVAALITAILAAGHSPAASQAPPSHTVRDGAARFEVLTPTLIRLEYAADGSFEDGATFNVINRALPKPSSAQPDTDGWLVINTDELTLRYRDGSGPFNSSNTSISAQRRLVHGDRPSVVAASPGPVRLRDQMRAEDGRLDGGESVNYDHTGFTGRGFTADYGQVAPPTLDDHRRASHRRLHAAGALRERRRATRTLSATSAGSRGPAQSAADRELGHLGGRRHAPCICRRHEHNQHHVRGGDGCNVNLDSVAVTAPRRQLPDARPARPAAAPIEPGQLGRLDPWIGRVRQPGRHGPGDDSCIRASSTARAGRCWTTRTALRTSDGWATPRPDPPGPTRTATCSGMATTSSRRCKICEC